MQARDSPYQVLGVAADASDRDIKKAYRALSMEHHPDRNAGNKDSTAAFQRISEAYETIIDPESRQQYDVSQTPQGRDPRGGVVDINELFGMMFRGGGMHFGGAGGMAFSAGAPPAEMFDFGGGRTFCTNFGQRPPPPPIVTTVSLSLEQCYNGCSLPISVDRQVCRGDIQIGETEVSDVHFPPGIGEGDAVVMTGFGHVNREGQSGSVKIVVSVAAHPTFSRRGLDLVLRKSLTLSEALCGFSFSERHLSGKTINIENKASPAVIHPGYCRTIPSMGMTREGHVGNMIIEFVVDFPKSLTLAQMDGIADILNKASDP